MQLTNEEYNVLLSWAERNFTPIKSINEEVCAYTIHGIFERLYDKGFYVTEHDVIRAMKDCGYQAVQRESRALQIFYASLGVPSKDRKFEWM